MPVTSSEQCHEVLVGEVYEVDVMIEHSIRFVTEGIEILAVAIIVGGILYYAWKCLFQGGAQARKTVVRVFKDGIGRTMLLGLELLVAADIIQTVILEFTVQNVLALGLLVLVRTFLAWSLEVEIEGRWPWKTGAETNQEAQ